MSQRLFDYQVLDRAQEGYPFRTVTTLITRVMYGFHIGDEHEHFVSITEKALNGFKVASTPGKYLVDTIPIRTSFVGTQALHNIHQTLVKYVPSWFPGASFKRRAVEWKKLTYAMINLPFNLALSSIVRSYVSTHGEIMADTWKQRYLGRGKGIKVFCC